VNIAHRLQGLAHAGDVVISGTAYDQVEKKLGLGFEFRGEQRVKNIDKPVRVYRILTDPTAAGKTLERIRRSPLSIPRAIIVIAAALLVVGAAAATLKPWRTMIEPGLSLPSRPSIAVLPFANMSGDPRQEYFADGMTDDLITDLSQVSGLFVIARNSSFAYKGRTVDISQISRELGVRYVLEGSIQRAGDRVRINAQLIDAVSGGHAWAERYDGSLSEVFALQDRVTRSVADALALRLAGGDELYQAQAETSVPAAYEAFLRGWEHYRGDSPQELAQAIPYFEEAIKLDPDYGRAHAAIALVYATSFASGWTASLGIGAPEAVHRARQYLEHAGKRPSALAHQAAGLILLCDRGPNLALEEFKQAIDLDPSDSWSYLRAGFALISAGRPQDSLRYIDTAMRLDPHPPSGFLFVLGLARFGLEQYDVAATSLESATGSNPGNQYPFLLLGAAYGYLGRPQDARSAIARYNEILVRLGGVPETVLTAPEFYYTQNADLQRLIKGLRLAGMPEFLDQSEFAKQNSLGADEIRALLFGHRLHGRNLFSGEERAASFTAEGAVRLSGDWGTLSSSTGPMGIAQFEGARLCLRFDLVSYCGIIVRNPGGTTALENEFIWLHPSGRYSFSRVL
jgi:TolB-like protein/Tfp pilus assembly protein PilF